MPLSWLRDYVDLSMPTQELADRLSISAAEVNSIEPRGPVDEDGNHGLFLVGKVIEAGKHPNADRLQLCQVDVGEGAPRQIVCGAWNFGAGATVAVALPGAKLPGAEAPLGEAKLRGEVSRGMILSERELELGGDHAGIIVLPETRARDATRRRAPARGLDSGRRADGEPGRLALRLRPRARGRGALRPRACAASRRRPGAAGRGERRHSHRRPRRLPPLRGSHLRRGQARALAAVASRPPHGRRDASDLQRRRHHELCDARARKPAPRVRSHLPCRRPDRRAACGARREAPDARRRRPRAGRAGPRDRRRGARDRARRNHGWRGDGSARLEHRDLARGSQLRAVRALAELGAAQAADRRARIAGRRASIRISPRRRHRSRHSSWSSSQMRAGWATAMSTGSCRPAP